MNRRQFVQGLVVLPFIGTAVTRMDWVQSYLVPKGTMVLWPHDEAPDAGKIFAGDDLSAGDPVFIERGVAYKVLVNA